MRNLIQLFLRYGGVFLFLLLEGVSFYLVVQYNESQNKIWFSSVNNLTGSLDEFSERTSLYMHLQRINDSLAAENAWLRSKLLNRSYFQTEQIIDSILAAMPDSPFVAIPAMVVNNSTTRSNNFITLNKGSNDGVEPHMGVIAPNGIVGIVREVSSNYAVAMSLLHRQTRITAALKKGRDLGSLIWQDIGRSQMYLEDIPKHANLAKGDTVITSGYSYRFPKDIPIGVVDTFWLEPGSNSHTIKVKLFIDLNRIEYVQILKNLNSAEPKQLEQAMSNE
ncbi:MAG: rod shape-determining protein MreC [Phaeodactylibacter sp.]|nr:rod shape-determining protein MreC [Phaeodactylibacter sp.]